LGLRVLAETTSRNQKVLARLDKQGRGIEIGASISPVAPKRAGFNVEIIDHLDRDGLLAKYRDHKENPKASLSQIEEVDYVWSGQSYTELTGKSNHYDWVIASHVVEHVPDLVRFLQDCESLLKADGVLSLVVPDKRYCFDYYRPISGIGKVLDNFYQKQIKPSPGMVAEYYLNLAVTERGSIAWSENYHRGYRLNYSHDVAVGNLNEALDDAYIDVHMWCFVPSSFRLIIHDLHALGLIGFQEVGFSPTSGCEFFITLGSEGSGNNFSRQELLDAVNAEQKVIGDYPWLPVRIGRRLMKKFRRNWNGSLKLP
jgi:SAM-dependent methyltransferase